MIIARTNNHLAGVANSDVLRVEAVNSDGTITVRRRLDRDEATGQRLWESTTFRYGGYGTADLAYGATAHTKQGKTVTAGIILVTDTETAEWLYSAMPRRRIQHRVRVHPLRRASGWRVSARLPAGSAAGQQ